MSEEVQLKINTTPRDNISEISDTEKEFRRKVFWKSCCGCNLDKRAVKFFSQLTISLIVVIFSLYQLHKDKNTEIYLSLLTMILGVYVEAPRLV
tara:strand:- start:230 stop:511 length:282 start_codon:yes stop_codon:yes gene_type:complete